MRKMVIRTIGWLTHLIEKHETLTYIIYKPQLFSHFSTEFIYVLVSELALTHLKFLCNVIAINLKWICIMMQTIWHMIDIIHSCKQKNILFDLRLKWMKVIYILFSTTRFQKIFPHKGNNCLCATWCVRFFFVS